LFSPRAKKITSDSFQGGFASTAPSRSRHLSPPPTLPHPIRLLHNIRHRTQQIRSGNSEVADEARDGLVVGFALAVGQDVFDRDARRHEMPRHEQCAVAVERFLFGAHEGEAARRRFLCDARDALLKERGFRDALIAHLAPAAEFAPEIEVFDTGFLERAGERVAAKLRMPPAMGHRADIAEHLDLMRAEEFEKARDRVVRMPDGRDDLGHDPRLTDSIGNQMVISGFRRRAAERLVLSRARPA